MKSKISFSDPIVDKISSTIELPKLVKTKDVYLDLVEIIVSQQLSGKVAKVIFDRFLNLFENKYPKPIDLVNTDIKTLRSVGLSNSKANYVKNLAEFAINNDLSVKQIEKLTDNEIIELLTQIKGIGKWSVEMLLIFSLHRPDLFPYDDLVIKKSMVEEYGIKKEGKKLIREMNSVAEKWRPNRSLASRYLWANYGLKNKQQKKKK